MKPSTPSWHVVQLSYRFHKVISGVHETPDTATHALLTFARVLSIQNREKMVEVLEHEFGSPEAREKVLNLTKKFFANMPAEDRRAYGKHWKSMIEGQDGENVVPCDSALDLFRRSALPFDTLEMIWDVSCQSSQSSLNQTEFLFALRMIAAAQSGIKPPITADHLFKTSLKPPLFDSPRSQDTRSARATDEPPPTAERSSTPKSQRSLSRNSGGGSGKLEKPSRSGTKKRHKSKHKKSRRAVNVNAGDEGLADAETASISSQPGGVTSSSSIGGDTGSEGGNSDAKERTDRRNAFSNRAKSMPTRSKNDRKPTPTSPAPTSSNSSAGSENGDTATEGEISWVLSERTRVKYEKLFPQADKDGDGFVGPTEARDYFSQSRLSKTVLREVWFLADTHRDGKGLRLDEFVVAMHVMMKVKHEDIELPKKLPQCLAEFIDNASGS